MADGRTFTETYVMIESLNNYSEVQYLFHEMFNVFPVKGVDNEKIII